MAVTLRRTQEGDREEDESTNILKVHQSSCSLDVVYIVNIKLIQVVALELILTWMNPASP